MPAAMADSARLRIDATFRREAGRLVGALPQAEPDERLRLLFLCCHPALSADAQIALTLRAVAGLTTAEIASAFLASEAAIAQRILRAKRKVAAARIPYRVPDDQLAER